MKAIIICSPGTKMKMYTAAGTYWSYFHSASVFVGVLRVFFLNSIRIWQQKSLFSLQAFAFSLVFNLHFCFSFHPPLTLNFSLACAILLGSSQLLAKKESKKKAPPSLSNCVALTLSFTNNSFHEKYSICLLKSCTGLMNFICVRCSNMYICQFYMELKIQHQCTDST